MPDCDRDGCLVAIQQTSTRLLPVLRTPAGWCTTGAMLGIEAVDWSTAVVSVLGDGADIHLQVTIVPPESGWVTLK